MSTEEMQEAIRIIDGRAETECSGNVTKENISRLTSLGVDYISSGALTHSRTDFRYFLKAPSCGIIDVITVCGENTWINRSFGKITWEVATGKCMDLKEENR